METKNNYLLNFILLLLAGLSLGLLSGCGIVERFTASPEVVLEPTPTRTPWPTFTPTATIDIAQLMPTATNTPPPPPSPTPTPIIPTPTSQLPTATNTPIPPAPKARVSGVRSLNVRAGPSTAYQRIGQVTDGHTSDILGRNNDNSWVYIKHARGEGWVSAQYVQIEGNVNTVQVIQVQPPPPPQNNPPPPPQNNPPPAPPPGPSHQYTIHNIFGQTNGAITQVRGEIRDANGNHVNGVRVRVRSGSFCTVAYPSGPPGKYPNGAYDILLDNRAKPGNWQVSIVDGPANPEDTQCNGNLRTLSEEVSVPTNTVEGVVFVEWRKNW